MEKCFERGFTGVLGERSFFSGREGTRALRCRTGKWVEGHGGGVRFDKKAVFLRKTDKRIVIKPG